MMSKSVEICRFQVIWVTSIVLLLTFLEVVCKLRRIRLSFTSIGVPLTSDLRICLLDTDRPVNFASRLELSGSGRGPLMVGEFRRCLFWYYHWCSAYIRRFCLNDPFLVSVHLVRRSDLYMMDIEFFFNYSLRLK
jgi:hypothetical protein